MSFQESTPLKKRIELSSKILSTYPDRVPVIVQRGETAKLPHITRQKFLAPDDISMARFVQEIRKHIDGLEATTAIFVFLEGNVLPPQSALMAQIYRQHKSEDGFLYLTYCNEEVFG
jgi:GABA(A) receptor-associated protein